MTFWNELLKRSCPHRFAWPRVDSEGSHYQICLLCGTAYEYDWKMMRRTDRVVADGVQMSRPACAKIAVGHAPVRNSHSQRVS